MRKRQVVAFIALGVFILILGPALSRILTLSAEKPGRSTPREETKWADNRRQHEFDSATAAYRFDSTWLSGLPPWFQELDQNEDGQISLHEWLAAGKNPDEFHQIDLDDDGFVTADEVFQYLKKPIELTLAKGQAKYQGTIELADGKYRGYQQAKYFTIRLERGKPYQFDHISQHFAPYLFLEDSDGNLLAENANGGNSKSSRILYRAAKTGSYRLIATSSGNFRPGAFSFSVRDLYGFHILPKNLPEWFLDLDKDGDGKIGLDKWLKSGREMGEFHGYDRNNDNFVTADEVFHHVETSQELKLQNGQLNYQGNLKEMAEERYEGKVSFKVFTIKLEGGKTYQFDQTSKEFQPYLYLEDSEGNLLMENSADNVGGTSRLIYRPTETGTYRLIATSLAGVRTGPFSLTIRVVSGAGGVLLKDLPPWFKELDTNEDGQVSLAEWRAAGRDPDEFRKYDLNSDGFISMDEVFRLMKQSLNLKLQNGRVKYEGTIEEMVEDRYQDKKSFKVFTVRLESGKTYEIDHASNAFQPFLYLEDAAGEVLKDNSDDTIGNNARLIYRADRTGIYRLIATSSSGDRTGAFSLSIRALSRFGRNLPAWFREIDKDDIGQISIDEWRKRGKSLAQFRAYDLNGDGIITADEVLRLVKQSARLKLQNGQANYEGVIEEMVEERYQGKKSFKILTIRLESGRTYQIDHNSRAYQAFLYLEDLNGDPLMESSADNIGGLSRLVFRATTTGTYSIIVTSLGGYKVGDFSLSVRVLSRFSGDLLKGVPAWFKGFDKDGRGQVTFSEWLKAGGSLDEFSFYDLNGDGLITLDEILRIVKQSLNLKLHNGQVYYEGTLEEMAEERYQGKKSFKIFTIRLESGKTYQFDHASEAYQAFLHLEDPEGNVAMENSADNIGSLSRLIYRASETGTYRLIVTSQGGYKTGAFSLTIRAANPALGVNMPKDLPAWFKLVDQDGEGQISLYQWREVGGTIEEFQKYDLNGDGFITVDEVLRYLKKHPEPKH